ncbi:MAG: hypothetical protein RL148_2296 [Planctomycetota bacterium]
MRCSLTPFGIKAAVFGAVIALIFLATPYTSLFFLLVSFLAVLGALGTLWGAANLRHVRVVVDPPPMARAGEDRNLVLHASTSQGTSLGTGILLELDSGETLDVGCFPWVHGVTRIEARIAPCTRGIRSVRAVVVWSDHPLGFLRWRRRLPLARPVELVTHPRRSEVTPRVPATPALGVDSGTSHAPAKHGVVSSVRPWREGDDLRSVDWKASARRNDWVVREFEAEATEGVEMVLDRRCQETAFEAMLEQAAAVVADRTRDQLVRIVSQEHDCTYGTEGKPVEAALHWMAALTRMGADAPAPPRAGPHALVLPQAEGAR